MKFWKRFAAITMIAVMGVLAVNNMIYIHVHVLPDGTMITHSHPFSKSSETDQSSSHKHSGQSLLFFQDLQLLFLTVLSVLCLRRPIRQVLRLVRIQSDCMPAFLPVHPGRAPPVLD